jgi:hypothetical protein
MAVRLQLGGVLAREHAAVEAKLGRDPAFPGLPEREQVKRYAALIQGRPTEPWLHLVRKGRLERTTLRRRFRSPATAREYLETLEKGSTWTPRPVRSPGHSSSQSAESR